MPALALAIQIIEGLLPLVPSGIAAIQQIEKTVSTLKLVESEDRDPTDAEWEDFNATVEALRAARPPLDE